MQNYRPDPAFRNAVICQISFPGSSIEVFLFRPTETVYPNLTTANCHFFSRCLIFFVIRLRESHRLSYVCSVETSNVSFGFKPLIINRFSRFSCLRSHIFNHAPFSFNTSFFDFSKKNSVDACTNGFFADNFATQSSF